MRTRIITAAIGIPLALALVWSPTKLPFEWAVIALTDLCLLELIRMPRHKGLRPNMAAAFLGLFVVLAGRDRRSYYSELIFGALLFGTLLVAWHRTRADVWAKGFRPSLKNLGLGLLAAVYIGVPFACVLALRNGPDGAAMVTALLAATWAGDSAAYFVGSTLGKTKLAPRISPKKTVEGSVANVAASVLVSVGLGALFGFAVARMAPVGLIIGVFGQVGDLFESWLKRQAGVKDSGSILPGHGGVLDRFDSLLFSAPFVYWYVSASAS